MNDIALISGKRFHTKAWDHGGGLVICKIVRFSRSELCYFQIYEILYKKKKEFSA